MIWLGTHVTRAVVRGHAAALNGNQFRECQPETVRKKVDHFNVIGGGMYKVEFCIYLSEERSGWHGREV